MKISSYFKVGTFAVIVILVSWWGIKWLGGQNIPCAGHHRDNPRLTLRCNAFGAVLLSDTLTADRPPIPYNVYDDVCCSHNTTL